MLWPAQFEGLRPAQFEAISIIPPDMRQAAHPGATSAGRHRHHPAIMLSPQLCTAGRDDPMEAAKTLN